MSYEIWVCVNCGSMRERFSWACKDCGKEGAEYVRFQKGVVRESKWYGSPYKYVDVQRVNLK